MYKTREAQSETKKWEDYEIKLENGIFAKINDFVPTDKYIIIYLFLVMLQIRKISV